MDNLKEAGQVVSLMAAGALFAVLVSLLFGTGCAAQTHNPTAHKPKKTQTAQPSKLSSRCKVLGKAKTSHAYVVVTRGCMSRSTTSVSIVVLNQEKRGKIAGDHAMQAVTSILGYRPKLGLLSFGTVKGKYLVVAAVIDPSLALQTAQ